jgi:hypothetical protein
VVLPILHGPATPIEHVNDATQKGGRAYDDDEVQRLLEAFKARYPEIFARWIELEALLKTGWDGDLREIQLPVIKFLRQEATWTDSSLQLTSVFVDMRMKVIDLIWRRE